MQTLKLDSTLPLTRKFLQKPSTLAVHKLSFGSSMESITSFSSNKRKSCATPTGNTTPMMVNFPAVPNASMMVELTLSIRGLISSSIVDSLTSSTANNNNKTPVNSCFISTYLEPPGSDRWVEVGLTEVAPVSSYVHHNTENYRNNDSILFAKKFMVQYRFQERQMLKFELYDGDCSKATRQIGRCEASLGEIVYSSLFGPFERRLTRPEGLNNRFLNTAVLQISAEEVTGFKETVLMQFTADHLPSKMFRKHAFFYELHRVKQNGELTIVHRSQEVTAHRSVAWPAFTVNLQTLCNGNLIDETLRFSLWRRRRNGVSVKLISFFNTTTRHLMEGSRSLHNIYRMEKRCTVRLAHFEKATHLSFLDHVHANAVQLHCVVAVDFSASNGPAELPSSLHHLKSGYSNQYQTALRAVLEILQDYDSDKLFPAFGFGALNFAKSEEIISRFNLNGNPSDANCIGIEGVMTAYERSVRTVRMTEPSNFAPIIRHVAKMASNAADGRNYYILLVVTDGQISDVFETVNAIVDASTTPMSIIIVGVGNGDFTSMRALDADNSVLVNSDGCCMERDIVQFVPFADIVGGAEAADKTAQEVQADLAREVLREIPDQFLLYMSKLEVFGQHPASAVANCLNMSERTDPNTSFNGAAQNANRSY